MSLAGVVLLYSFDLWAVELRQEPCPDGTVPFHQIRMEYVTKATWATLQIEDPEAVLTARAIQFRGFPGGYDVRADRVGMGQPLSAVKEGRSVQVTVDYAVTVEAVQRPFSLELQRGSVEESQVRIYAMNQGAGQLLKELVHPAGVDEQTARDPLRFSLDLKGASVTTSCGTVKPRTNERLLWAFYYPWYTVESWTSRRFSDFPLIPYDSGDPKVILDHIEAASHAGIDGFISSWWGPGSESDRNLPLLLDLAKDRAFKVSLYFETEVEGRGRSPEEITNWLAYAIATYRNHSAMMKVGGRPLIVIWASDHLSLESWQDIFGKLRSRGLDAVYLAMGYGLQKLEVFDGVHDYSIVELPSSDLANMYKQNSRVARFYGLLANATTQKISVATVQPGYDERLVPGRKGVFRDREDGAFYRGTFEAALSGDPDWIFITTWNEWYEHTHIEPSRAHGARYLEITSEYAKKWREQK